MKLLVKIFGLLLLLAALFALEFFLVGDRFELVFSQEACARWFAERRSSAWAIGILLLIADLLLPVPTSGIMAALGAVYGFWPGMLFGMLGSFAAGCPGYFLALFFGGKGVRWLADDEELETFQGVFRQWGGLAIIASRLLPILPEVLTIAAGLSRMPPSLFLSSLLVGCLPPAALYSFLGASMREAPLSAVVLASLAPLPFWPWLQKRILAGPTTRTLYIR